jgi:hypothetical protein
MDYTDIARRLAELRDQVSDHRIAADLEAIRQRVKRLANDVLLRGASAAMARTAMPVERKRRAAQA